MTATISAIRGPVLTYSDEPYLENKHNEFGYEPDAIIMIVLVILSLALLYLLRNQGMDTAARLAGLE